MRHGVFLLVLLSLALSLSKGATSTTTPPAPVTTTTGTSGTTSTATPPAPVTTTTGTSGTTSTATPPAPVTTTTGTSGTTSTATPPAPVTTTTGTSGTTSTATPPAPVTTTTGTSGTTSTATPPAPVTTTTGTSGTTSTATPPAPVTTTTGTSGTTSTATPPAPVTTTTGTSGTTSTATPPAPVTTTTGTSGTTSTATPPAPVTTTTGTSGTTSTATPPAPVTTTTGTSGTTSTATPPAPVTTTTGTSGTTSTATPPAPVTTTAGTSGATSTATPPAPVTTTTGTSGTTSTATPPATVTTTTGTSGKYCDSDPCGKLAKCVELFSNFTCLCQYGFYYNNKDCLIGEVYPGVITLKGSYSDSVQSVNSMEYEEVFQNITAFFEDVFRNYTDFEQTVIMKIQLHKSRASSVDITVTNLFKENSAADNETITYVINKATQSLSDVYSYRGETYCDAYCDKQTTDCKEEMFPKCECKSSFSKTEWDDRSCSDCASCSAAENEHCVKENGIPTCKCMINFERKYEKCVACSVGYSGDNCNNNSELILIIVGTVFGAIILSLVIAVSIVSVRAKHKQDPEKKSLIKSRYSNSNTSDARQNMIFPRVQTTSGHANPGYQPNNPYETCSANKDRYPERDYDDLYDVSREPEGFRMQRRY